MSAVVQAALGKKVGQSLKVKEVEDDAPLLVSPAHNLEEEVGVPVVVGEVPDLVDHQQAGAVAVVVEPLVEAAGGLLAAEVEEHLRRGCRQKPRSLLRARRSDPFAALPVRPWLRLVQEGSQCVLQCRCSLQ